MCRYITLLISLLSIIKTVKFRRRRGCDMTEFLRSLIGTHCDLRHSIDICAVLGTRLFLSIFNFPIFYASFNPKQSYKCSYYCSLCQNPLWIPRAIRNSALKLYHILYLALTSVAQPRHPMMTSSNVNIFRVTGPLCMEFTGHRWIPLTKASDGELWCFLWSASE